MPDPVFNDNLYYIEVDYDNDMYNTTFVYAQNPEEAVKLIDKSVRYNPMEDKIFCMEVVNDITSLNEERLDSAAVSSMQMGYTKLFTDVLEVFRHKNIVSVGCWFSNARKKKGLIPSPFQIR